MKILLAFSLIIAGTVAVTTVTGYRGRSVQIKCSYESGYKNNKKYLCRRECPSVGSRDVPVHSGSSVKDSRFSLDDNKKAKVFTVTITDLRPEDGGTYWCAIERTGPDIYKETLLKVITDVSAGSTVRPSTHNTPSTRSTRTTHTSPATHTTSTHSTSPSEHAESTCSTPDTPVSNASNPSRAPSSQEFPTSTVVIAVSVVLVLLLIALLFAVALRCRKKTRASSHQSFSKNHVAPLPVCGNETKDIRCLNNTIYSNDQSLTNPLAFPQTIHSNPGLHPVPFDSPHMLYSTVHKHPSKSPDQDVYSTAQLPTIPSDSTVSAAPASAEDPMYAEVTFNTGSIRAAPTMIYKNESNSCDYATVTATGCG